MTREEIIEGLKLLEDNMVYFDELLNDKGEYIDVHELLFEAIEVIEQEPKKDIWSIKEVADALEKHRLRMSEISEIEIKSMTKEQNYMRGYEDGKSDVLDKIRAELHATAEMHEDGDYYLRDEWIDKIIDKYKGRK